MKVYIISLYQSETEKNKLLATLLNKYGHDVCFINAISGSDINAIYYYSLIGTYLEKTKILLTPSELGCLLSHKEALSDFVATGESHALILEDDVIIDDLGLEKLLSIINNIQLFDGFINIGGQYSIHSSRKNIEGKIIQNSPDICKIDNDYLYLLQRTFAYLIASADALKILVLMNDHPFIMDDYVYIYKNAKVKNFYLSSIFSHPVDLAKSTIENERIIRPKLNNTDKLIRRIYSEIKKTVYFKVLRIKSFFKILLKLIDHNLFK
jgi:glycosyl transferase, family 25